MIISCSRRTDIPAFYSGWLMERIRAGYCIVPNPLNPRQISKLSLKPEDVTAIVFWTRYPEPLIKDLGTLNEIGYKYYFQISINNYGKKYEKNNPNIKKVLKSVEHLTDKIGPRKIIWRYDPVILDDSLNYDFHIMNFSFLIKELKKSVKKIITSVITPYRKVLNKMKNLEKIESDKEKVHKLLQDFNSIANTNSLQLEICSYHTDLTSIGIKPAKCIDNELLNALYGLNLSYRKDKSQRKECDCTISKDIGQYNSCLMNCLYCYATTSNETALRNYQKHTIKTETIY
ncbi:MAG: DUF1848 domain-containing protein [Bacteroidetes bacterium]|nr:MAG: DUF1848 domain-containing protein [Bacteroidota bacterium]